MYREIYVSMSGGSSLNGVFQGAFVISGERMKITIILSLLRPTWLSDDSVMQNSKEWRDSLKSDEWACLYEEISI